MIELPEVKYIIAIASGKGGVGKSTTAINLALALSQENLNVGILDADIYGPSIPLMLGITEKPQNELSPIIQYNIQSISIGYFLDPESPAIWRGPIVSKYLLQLFQSTQWKNLDYLIVDLPPGTGDIQLTLSQKIRVTGSVIVTTPQDIALIDAKKAAAMFQKVHVPVLGVIENMSTHICSHCGHEENIFGTQGAEKIAEKFNIELLGKLPLDINIRVHSDEGKPIVIAEPESKITFIYKQIAKRLIEKINNQNRLQSKMPKFTVK
jgi:ATP-binding protein involved in chromosome partitioning